MDKVVILLVLAAVALAVIADPVPGYIYGHEFHDNYCTDHGVELKRRIVCSPRYEELIWEQIKFSSDGGKALAYAYSDANCKTGEELLTTYIWGLCVPFGNFRFVGGCFFLCCTQNGNSKK